LNIFLYLCIVFHFHDPLLFLLVDLYYFFPFASMMLDGGIEMCFSTVSESSCSWYTSPLVSNFAFDELGRLFIVQ
jgi:hypothetical protein